jgi:hypothetical protein
MSAYCKRRKCRGTSTQARGGICRRNPFQQKTRETTEEDSREGHLIHPDYKCDLY